MSEPELQERLKYQAGYERGSSEGPASFAARAEVRNRSQDERRPERSRSGKFSVLIEHSLGIRVSVVRTPFPASPLGAPVDAPIFSLANLPSAGDLSVFVGKGGVLPDRFL